MPNTEPDTELTTRYRMEGPPLMNATNAALMCCGRPMATVPARPQDEPFTELWLCRECGHHEPVDPDDEYEFCDSCGAELETEPDMRYDPLCPSCALIYIPGSGI